MNDTDRVQWIENDESLYLLWQESGIGLWRFAGTNRELIDNHVNAILGNRAEYGD